MKLNWELVREKFLRPRIIGALGVLLLMGGSAPTLSAQAECKVPFDANDKMAATPHHSYMTETAQAGGGKARTSELILANGAMYIQVQGKWRKSPMTGAQMQQQLQENRKTAKNVSCKYLREEMVSGEMAGVYSAHSETEDGDKSDITIWVAKGRGLIVREEQDMDVGGAMGKSHRSTRIEYNNVSAPAI